MKLRAYQKGVTTTKMTQVVRPHENYIYKKEIYVSIISSRVEIKPIPSWENFRSNLMKSQIFPLASLDLSI